MTSEIAEVLVGTYEDFIVGYQIMIHESKTELSPREYSFEQSFAVRFHSGSVRCLTKNQSGTLAISCGVDEMVNIFSLKRRKLLHTMEVPATCATFVRDSHIILGTSEGDIYIYEFSKASVNLVKTLGGHKSAVISMSVHPSAKILLSLSKDNTMRTWNLIKGRSAYVTNIKTGAHSITWSKSGDQFLLVVDSELYHYDLSGSLKKTCKVDKRINHIDFLSDNLVMIASDSGFVEIMDLEKGSLIHKQQAHESRIKSAQVLEPRDKSKTNDSCPMAITCSSDGQVKLWSIQESNKFKELTKVDTGARITCMTIAESVCDKTK